MSACNDIIYTVGKLTNSEVEQSYDNFTAKHCQQFGTQVWYESCWLHGSAWLLTKLLSVTIKSYKNEITDLTQTYFDFSFKHVSFPWVNKFFYVNFDSLIWFHNSKVGISPVKTSFSAINVPELVVPVFFT